MGVLFINSFPRSGSTLLGNLLGLHKQIKYLGEVRNAVPPTGDTIFQMKAFRDSVFWSKVIDSLAGENRQLTTKVGYGVTEEQCFDNIRTLYSRCVSESGCEWIVDSSHRTREAKSHVAHLNDELKIIYLVRDCRAVLNSVLKRKQYQSVPLVSVVFLYQRFRFEFGAKLLKQAVKKENLLVVRYEDLCATPMDVLNEIAGFMGVDNFSVENFDQSLDGVYVGGSSTFAGVSENLSNIKEDLSWKHELPLLAGILAGAYKVIFNNRL